MIKKSAVLLLSVFTLLLSQRVGALHISFEHGDIFLSLEQGLVQWRLSDGTLFRELVGTVPGAAEGMAFDSNGNLYVTRWCVDPWCSTGSTVEMFDVLGRSWGAVGSGYNCNPHALVFGVADTAYVGQAGCSGSILKFVPGEIAPIQFNVVPENQGSFWLDLGNDGCTIFYTSWGPNVKRFDGCAGVQLPDFNVAPMPGGIAHDLQVLPDGGLIVSSGQVIARLDASGVLIRTYSVPEATYWAGLDRLEDGTFWAVNYETSNVYRFSLATGSILGSFYAASPPHSVVAVKVMPLT